MSLQSEPTMSQLRREIDRGRTGDKVDFPDPAAAPLGTDEEAGGTPTPAAAVAQAHRDETVDDPEPATRARNRRGAMVLAILALASVALTAFAIWATFHRP